MRFADHIIGGIKGWGTPNLKKIEKHSIPEETDGELKPKTPLRHPFFKVI